MLRCADGAYYVGSFRGDDSNWRVVQHNDGVFPNAWTARRRPVELVWSEHFDLFMDAFTCERRLKGWSRAKKEALIRGEHDALPGLARSRTPKPSAFARRLKAGPLEKGRRERDAPSFFDRLRMRTTSTL
jgi:putative endonuclease